MMMTILMRMRMTLKMMASNIFNEDLVVPKKGLTQRLQILEVTRKIPKSPKRLKKEVDSSIVTTIKIITEKIIWVFLETIWYILCITKLIIKRRRRKKSKYYNSFIIQKPHFCHYYSDGSG